MELFVAINLFKLVYLRIYLALLSFASTTIYFVNMSEDSATVTQFIRVKFASGESSYVAGKYFLCNRRLFGR